jgi:cysteine desulfurase / selenocysteine lyase
MLPTDGLDAHRIRDHFAFAETGRVVTNNAATTQPPRELVDLYASLVPEYENVHRGQSQSSKTTTERFEASFDTIAAWLNAPSRRTIALYRNATEAHNAVMYTMLTEVRDGDNVVTTLLEHNSNYVPWYALCKEILPRFGIHAECRLARFDHATGQLDLAHLAELVDSRTKIVCCTGASNFLGTRPPLSVVRQICRDSGYVQPDGRDGSLLLVDGAQLVPSSHVDVAALDVDYLSFSFHKFLAPFGIGVLYAKEHLLQESLPFLYGGDMIAEGQVTPDHVGYNDLPWKYSAGTPNILGAIISAESLRLIADLTGDDKEPALFRSDRPIEQPIVRRTMTRLHRHATALTAYAIEQMTTIPGLQIHGPQDAANRAPLIAFNVQGWHPVEIAESLGRYQVEARAGCHCATLAHQELALDPLASCRLSFALYNTADDIDRAVDTLRWVLRRKSGQPV